MPHLARTRRLEFSFDDEFVPGHVNSLVASLESRLRASGGSVHCGGQFEWVDGQLVRALQCGHWLLIDNVNFCRWADLLNLT